MTRCVTNPLPSWQNLFPSHEVFRQQLYGLTGKNFQEKRRNTKEGRNKEKRRLSGWSEEESLHYNAWNWENRGQVQINRTEWQQKERCQKYFVDETSSTKSFSELVVKSKHHVVYCQERLREKKWTSFLSRDNGGQKREKRHQPNLAQLGLLPIGSAMDKNSSRLHDIIIISPIRVSIRKEDKMR